MSVYVGKVYTIKMSDYPWTDSYAKAHSTLHTIMLKEADAKKNLDGYEIEIIDHNPPQDKYYKGDKGVGGKWVRGKMKNGPLMYTTMAVLDRWLLPASTSSNACTCDINTILAKGCQCGGI